jgi:deoxycytidine triphosphate deaminase
MKFLDSEGLKELVQFAADTEKQTSGGKVTLSLREVLQITGEGRVAPDSGEGDLARTIKRPARRSAGDPAGYWELTQGVYWVTYNESVRIPDDGALILQPHEGIMINGLWHPTLVVRDWADMKGVLLTVGARGVRLEEGAPVSIGYVTSG